MASSTLTPSATSTSPPLTPSTKTEAEAALTYNALYQTSSAGGGTKYQSQSQSQSTANASHGQYESQSQPQSQHPSSSRDMPIRTTSHHYADACHAAGLPPTSLEPPYPTEETAEQVKGTLSRGTTQAVLQKMDSISSGSGVVPDETVLGRRFGKEGEGRTSLVPPAGMIGGPSGKAGAGGTVDQRFEAGGATAGQNVPSMFGRGAETSEKPRFDRTQSWKQQDMKRLNQEQMMLNVDKDHGAEYGYESEVEHK